MLSAKVLTKTIGKYFPENQCIYVLQNFDLIPTYIEKKYLAKVKIEDIYKIKLILKTTGFEVSKVDSIIDCSAIISIRVKYKLK